MDITKPNTMRELQGDRVLLIKHSTGELVRVMTLVRVVDTDRQSLHLSDRENKNHKPDWPLTQALADHFKPARPNAKGATWELRIK
jgi:hypothetical protein